MEVKKFDDLNLKKTLLRGIYSYGFEKPSAIQCKAIPELIKGTDIDKPRNLAKSVTVE